MSSIPNFTDIPWQTHASGTLAGWQEKAQQEMNHPADESSWLTPEQMA
jgi:hypothetical protein